MGLLNNISSWFQKAGNGIYKSVIKPIGNGISKAYDFVYDKVINPVGNIVKTTLSTGEKLISKTGDAVITVEQAGSSAASGLGSFLSSPLSYLAIGAAALIILPKLL